MTDGATLEGACSCGRNEYIILTPPSILQRLSVIYDDRAEHGQWIPDALDPTLIEANVNITIARSLSLRVPLSHIRSTTYAFYPGETHTEIRRVFTPRHAPHTKRHFCGFCGTPLTHWTEEHGHDADWVNVNLGSLRSESVEKLAEEGLLVSSDDALEKTANNEKGKEVGHVNTLEGREVRGPPWFEEMIEGSRLGRIKRQRGGQSSADGRSKVIWEVVEFMGEPSDSGNNTGKRRLSQVGKESDVEMKE
ncbi:MAG: hypothetical protein Q9166_002376 [cf. Caloplaca sp. 2 TL-2023]